MANEAATIPPLAAEQAFLGGKVIKRTLPVIRGKPHGDVPRLKRLLLGQGELAQLYDGPEGIQYIAAVELRADSVRGNHYHDRKQEWLYVITGEILLTTAARDTGARERIPVCAGDLIFIPAGIAHALRTVQPGLALEFSPVRFDPADVHPFALD